MFSCAWLWMYAGMLLMLLELAAPGFVVFFFGLAAMTVGAGRFAFGETFTMNWQEPLIRLKRWCVPVPRRKFPH